MIIKSKVQVISFETSDGSLGKFLHGSNERITIKQAEQILNDSEVEFKTVFQVRKEEVEFDIPDNELEKYIK